LGISGHGCLSPLAWHCGALLSEVGFFDILHDGGALCPRKQLDGVLKSTDHCPFPSGLDEPAGGLDLGTHGTVGEGQCPE
jgi:hypothetical protein